MKVGPLLSSAIANNFTTTNNQKVNDQKALLKELCYEFQAILFEQMLDAMRKTIPRSNLIPYSLAQRFFEDMLYQEYAKQLSQANTLNNLALILYESLSKYIGP